MGEAGLPRQHARSNRGTWPVSLTAFIGREDLLAELVPALLDPQAARLLTLTGPGGVGKSRLVLELLERTADDFPGHAWYVSFASVADAKAVPVTVARAITGREPGERPALAMIATAAGDEPGLLVLDNLEHLLDATPFVLDLLSALPKLKVLVTSRESLRLRPERVVIVPPLSVPEPGSILTEPGEAIDLFTECVRAIRPAFAPGPGEIETIAEICRRLDALPLAIELAAARCRALSPRALLDRLTERLDVLSQGPRDLPARQRTMRDTIRWSHDLLHEQDRAAFRRLGSFAGPFTLEAAEALLGSRAVGADPAPLDLEHVLDAVSSLLDKSLLREVHAAGGDQRFLMLQTIREFALEELRSASEEDDIRSLHAGWFQRRAAESWLALYQNDFDTSWLPRLATEYDDLQAALVWLEQHGEPLDLLRMAANLSAFAYFNSYRADLRAVLKRAESLAADAHVPPHLHAHVEHAKGLCAWGTPQALTHFERSLELWRQSGTAWGMTAAAVTLAEHLSAVGRYDEAIMHAEASIDAAARWNRFFHASCLMEIGHGRLGLGRLDAARESLDAAIAAAKSIDDPYVLGLSSNARAFVALETNDLAAARSALATSLGAWRVLGRAEGLVGALATGGLLALASADRGDAARLLSAIEGVCTAHEYTPSTLEQTRIDRLRSELQPLSEEAATPISTRDAAQLVDKIARGPVTQSEETSRPAGLTQRELEVLGLIAEGLSDREIAERLFISRATAARHAANIFLKIDVNSRTAAAVWAFQQGLVTR